MIKITKVSMVLAAMGTMCICAAVHAVETDLNKMLNEKSPALVTVKFVLKVSMGQKFGGDNESDTEITGVMIDPKGMVLCSNTQLGGFVSMMKSMMGSMGSQFSATPTDLKVLVGDDTEGREAELVARDTELDLAWIRMKSPADKPYDYVDFSKAAKVSVGDTIVSLRRLGKYFGRQAAIAESRIGGVIQKPRELLLPASALGTSLGSPVFVRDGQPLGMIIMQVPEAEGSAENPMAMMSRMSGMQDMMAGFILPAATIIKATERAMATSGSAESK